MKSWNKNWTGWIILGIGALISAIILIVNVGRAYKVPAETKEPEFEAVPVVAVVSSDETVTNEPVQANSETSEEMVEDVPVWHYYNSDLQSDDDKTNDYNFGPNPIKDLETPSAEEMDKEFRERLRQDPALGAADMAWFDSLMGTRYLRTFYSQSKEQWDAAMNLGKEYFIDNPDEYNKTLDAFFKYLDANVKMEVKYQKSGITDQMYMNPYTIDEIPDIIVLASKDHKGWFLVYTFTVKETATIEVAYRIDCGFQPTNVAKIMKVKVKPTPTKKKEEKKKTEVKQASASSAPESTPSEPSNPEPSDPKPSNPEPKKPDPKKPDPEPVRPDPDPLPTPPKDPTEGTPVLPNDDPGPGPDTNNPADPNHSTADLPTNSNHLTPDEYQEAMDENKEANEISREGGDDNVPSTPTPPGANVDNNGDNGTGNGGIDQPTPVQDSSVADDPAGSHWDGPSD